jgi:hypothetical protein
VLFVLRVVPKVLVFESHQQVAALGFWLFLRRCMLEQVASHRDEQFIYANCVNPLQI